MFNEWHALFLGLLLRFSNINIHIHETGNRNYETTVQQRLMTIKSQFELLPTYQMDSSLGKNVCIGSMPSRIKNSFVT